MNTTFNSLLQFSNFVNYRTTHPTTTTTDEEDQSNTTAAVQVTETIQKQFDHKFIDDRVLLTRSIYNQCFNCIFKAQVTYIVRKS